MDNRTNEGMVYFGLIGADVDLGVATETISIDWADIKSKDDPLVRRSSWRCSTGYLKSDYVSVYDMASSLVKRLVSHTSEIVDVKERYELDAVLQVVLYISTSDQISTPAIGFDKDVLDFVHTVGATIDVDTYLLPNYA